MAPRSTWKGFIKLSLVSVPVKGYSGSNTAGDVRLNQLHSVCNARIKYRKVCPEHGEVPKEEIASGYEFAKGQYVVIDPEEVNKLRTESDRSVTVFGFIPNDAVDARYYAGKTQYLVPDGPVGQKPYALLLRSMEERGLHALGQVVMSRKEQLVLLRPVEGVMTLNGLLWESRVKQPSAFRDEITEPELSEQEIALTETLVEASMLRDFDYAAYKDAYTDKLTRLIQMKIEGKEIVAAPEPEEPQIINLMEALKESVARAQAAAPGKMAPSTTTRKKKAPAKGPSSRKTG